MKSLGLLPIKQRRIGEQGKGSQATNQPRNLSEEATVRFSDIWSSCRNLVIRGRRVFQ